MFGRFAAISTLLAAIMIDPGNAQDWETAAKKIVVGDGPYEVKDESGVIGFVVASAGEMVTFKPCIGDSFPLNRKKLLKTINKCKDNPSPDENPLIAKCGNAWQGWDKTQIAQAIDSNKPIGTTFFQGKGDATMTSITMDPNQMASAIDSVDQLKDCGKFVVGFDKHGEAKVNLIPAMQAIQLDGQN